MRRETLVPRFYGSEMEYGFTPHEAIPSLHPPGVAEVGGFMENGSRMYVDCGLIEYATPESPTLTDLVTHEIAGERLVWEAYGNGRSELKTIHKRVRTPQGNHSTGSHENYSTINLIWPNGKDPHSHQLTLAAHYATRTVFSGAGQPTENGYAIAQKLQRVEYFAHPQATKKPLVDTKDEAHAGDSPLRRLQVSSGDANISPWALRMKFGTTSLVLRLLEHGVDVSDLHLKNSMFAAQRVAKDIDGLSVPFATSEKTMTALDIQEEFAHRARQLSSTIELPQEEQAVIAEWGTTVDALRRYSKTGEQQEPLRQIDWYTKKQVLDRYEERTGSATLAEKQALDLRYDQLSNGIGMRMRKERFAPHTPSEEAISNAQKNPPEGRAKLRGTLIKETTARNAFVRVGWDDARRDGYYSKKLPIDGDYGEVAIADLVTKIFGRE